MIKIPTSCKKKTKTKNKGPVQHSMVVSVGFAVRHLGGAQHCHTALAV